MSTQPLEILISSDSVCELVTIRPDYDADDLVNTYDLEWLGSGVSRKVFALSDQHVLKIKSLEPWCPPVHEDANTHEIALWEDLSEAERDQGTFARIYAYAEDHSWIISERIPYIGSGERSDDDKELMARYGVSDQHGENYGSREDGSFACIDYGYCGGYNSEDQPCYCGECDCRRCWQDGCACETFEGCHYHSNRCALCEAKEDERLKIVRDHLYSRRGWNENVPKWGANRRHLVARVPSDVLIRLERSAQNYADCYADTRRALVWSGDTSSTLQMVCRECADKLHMADVCEPDMAQGVLQFPNRYIVGLEIRELWRNGKRVTLPMWVVRDSLMLDNVGPLERRHFGRIVSDLAEGAEGYNASVTMAANLNNGLYYERAAKIARILPKSED